MTTEIMGRGFFRFVRSQPAVHDADETKMQVAEEGGILQGIVAIHKPDPRDKNGQGRIIDEGGECVVYPALQAIERYELTDEPKKQTREPDPSAVVANGDEVIMQLLELIAIFDQHFQVGPRAGAQPGM